MKVFIICSVILAFAWGENQEARIVGGKNANSGQFPFIASLRKPDGSKHGEHYCGASVLSPRLLLTAAHCDVKTDYFAVVRAVRLDGPNSVRYTIEKFIAHADYNQTEFDYNNDIGLVILTKSIEFDNLVKAIALPTKPSAALEEVYGIGWGSTRLYGRTPNQLQFVKLGIVSDEKCNEAVKLPNLNHKFCTLDYKRSRNTCHGDSGGPIARMENNKNEVIGVVSFGYSCDEGTPGIHVEVYDYLDWIDDNGGSYM